MMTTILIAAAYALPAVIARRRGTGAFKALVMSVLLTPLLALPIVLSVKARRGDTPDTRRQQPPSEGPGKYGYDDKGMKLDDGFILSETRTERTVLRNDPERIGQCKTNGESRHRGVGM